MPFLLKIGGRPNEEVDGLMHIFARMLHKETPNMLKEGIRVSTIGHLEPIPQFVFDQVKASEEATKGEDAIDFVLAINYGGRDEICRAVQALIEERGPLGQKVQVTEELIASYLDTHHLPDPDLLIRTSGEKRVSNFLLWQSSYSELYVPEIMWPDFRPHHLLEAVLTYQNRERRKGL